MANEPKDPAASLPNEIIEAIRAEPALAWFAAQALWMAQPALEAFWPAEKIDALAERFDGGLNRPAADVKDGR
jgi:hypothetical protein